MDTIIFAVLLATAGIAAKASKGKIVIPMWILGMVLTAILFKIHVSDPINVEF